MKFLVDRCAGRKLADWLRSQDHDVVESRTLGDDPGDEALLRLAVDQERILITIDNDFGKLVFAGQALHRGMIRLPDVPPSRRIELMAKLLTLYSPALEAGAVVTVRGDRIRISVADR